MPPAADLHALAHRLGARCGGRPGRLADRVGERLEIVAAGLARLGGKADDLPAPGSGEPLGVLRAEVIAVRLDVRREGAENGGGVSVDVR
jgi:hypothetical protein